MIRSLAGAPCWSCFSLALLVGGLVVDVLPARGQEAPVPSPAAATVTPVSATPAAAVALPPLPRVPNEVKSSTDIGANRTAVEQFITEVVGRLGDESNPQAQSEARERLLSEALVNGQPQASADYLNTYADLLNQQLLNLEKNPQLGPRARLNAAIATAQVARVAENGQLAGAAEAFIKDPSEAVALWGIKAARWIIPAQLAMVGMPQEADQLASAVVAAVKSHTKGQIAGAIAEDAYNALSLNITDQGHRAKLQQNPSMLQRIAPHMLKLLQQRLQQYRKGVPSAPRSEAIGTGFLSDPLVWGRLNPQLQQQTMQVMLDLIDLAAKQASALKVTTGDRSDLATMISRVSKAISIVAAPNSPGPVFDAIKPATALRPDSSAAQIVAAVNAVLPAVKTLPAFANLNPPPSIQGNEPAPPPASAPTTGPIAAPGAGSAVGNPNAKIIAPAPPPEAPPATPPAAPAPAPAQPPPAQPRPPRTPNTAVPHPPAHAPNPGYGR